MTRLWRGGGEPRDIPQWAYLYLVTTLKVDPDQLSQLKCVEQISFEGNRLVSLIRIFDPKAVPGTAKIEGFTSLDQHPDLIIFEGYKEKESGRVHFPAR